mmetsp:Transcript_26231/g.46261  ORF Transcript_26231/g.46261 Transcript_26231/m.46261 type:complete len:84 (-) Transcript_26231:138-389(-)
MTGLAISLVHILPVRLSLCPLFFCIGVSKGFWLSDHLNLHFELDGETEEEEKFRYLCVCLPEGVVALDNVHPLNSFVTTPFIY